MKFLSLEALEDRSLLSSAAVVPLTQPIDNQTTFHRLVDALDIATNAGDIVTIERGATADTGPVTVAHNGITIQSDPNSAGVLPTYDLFLSASNVTLTRLNLDSLVIEPDVGGNALLRSNVNNISVSGGTSGRGGNVFDHDTVSGSLVLSGMAAFPQTGNRVTNSTFTNATPGTGSAVISAQDENGLVIQNNSIGGQAQVGISLTRGLNDAIANNTIALNGGDLTTKGIVLQNPGAASQMTVTLIDNGIATGNGVGLFLNAFNDTTLQVLAQGNDFHNNAIGIDYLGGGGTALSSDLGGGSTSLGTSLGGNNFRGYPTATANGAAIRMTNVAAGATLHAENNIFNDPANPGASGFTSGPGTVDASNALTTNLAFVQTLYNNLLGRSGTRTELFSWLNLLTSSPSGQAAVGNSILHSTEGLTRVVDNLYLKYLGRAADSAGAAYWVAQLQNGTALETVEAAFLASPEFRSGNNSDYVQELFGNFLGRSGSAAEVAYWTNQLQQPNGVTAATQGFAGSIENRSRYVEGVFASLLHRPPSSAEISYFVRQRGDLLALEGMIMASAEFLNHG